MNLVLMTKNIKHTISAMLLIPQIGNIVLEKMGFKIRFRNIFITPDFCKGCAKLYDIRCRAAEYIGVQQGVKNDAYLFNCVCCDSTRSIKKVDL